MSFVFNGLSLLLFARISLYFFIVNFFTSHYSRSMHSMYICEYTSLNLNFLWLYNFLDWTTKLILLAFSLLGTTADHVEVEHYDPYSDTWALTCPALKYVTNFTAIACHGKLYVIGSCAVKYNALTMQCYNPVIGKNDWSRTRISKESHS